MIKLTYESLFKMQRDEKVNNELQKIDPDFFVSVQKYLATKKEILEQVGFSETEKEKIRNQLVNIHKIIKEIIERRQKKIIELAIMRAKIKDSVDNSAMIEAEKHLFEEIFKLILQYNLDVFKPVKKEPQVKPENNSKLVRFIQGVPKFMGYNGLTHGPFKPDDESELPNKIAQILIKKGRAEEISSQ